MPALNVPIPLAVLAVGQHSYGPAPVDDDVAQATITIDRTVSRAGTDGLNLQPATTTVEIAVWQSDDGGASWAFRAGAGLIGGTYESEPGVPYTFSNVSVELTPGAGRRVRADVTVGGARVAVAGSLVVQTPPVTEVTIWPPDTFPLAPS
jgi:hypothetical protein